MTRFHAVSRFKLIVPFGLLPQSSFMDLITFGISERSTATGSADVGGRGRTNSLSSSLTQRFTSKASLGAALSSYRTTVTAPFIILCLGRCSFGADTSTRDLRRPSR